jgi:hypothetical protein
MIQRRDDKGHDPATLAIFQNHPSGIIMIHTVEATIDTVGDVHLIEPIRLSGVRRALVTILDEPPEAYNIATLSEQALAKDWDRPEEDEAWAHLQ